MVRHPMILHYRKTRKGEWYWIVIAANNEPLARSSESYKELRDARRCWELIRGRLTATIEHAPTRADVRVPRVRKHAAPRAHKDLPSA